MTAFFCEKKLKTCGNICVIKKKVVSLRTEIVCGSVSFCMVESELTNITTSYEI